MKKRPTGFVVYKGPSLIDGQPIVAIAITGSRTGNRKTGDMVQTYILRDNGKSPYDNAVAGEDASICGDCRHKRTNEGSCYVDLLRGVHQVWKHYMKGGYPYSLLQPMLDCDGRMVRLGAYGDPAAVPIFVWKTLLNFSSGHTGYTHRWQDCDDKLMEFCMASVDSEEELVKAQDMGYRTFRVRHEADPVMQGEFECPASLEQLRRRTCETCKACNGGLDSHKASATIIVHGSWARRMK